MRCGGCESQDSLVTFIVPSTRQQRQCMRGAEGEVRLYREKYVAVRTLAVAGASYVPWHNRR